MNSIELLSQDLLADWPSRVCLPYGVDLLQLGRWVSSAIEGQVDPQFDIVVGGRSHTWQGFDVVELFGEIQKRCINYSLSSSYVYCKKPESMMFFDMHGRFSFFAAGADLINCLYPFTRELFWENFAILQEECDDIELTTLFDAIHSA